MPYFQPEELLIIANLPYAATRIWLCVDPEFKLCWMNIYIHIYKQHLYKQSPDTLMVNFALFQNYLLSSSTLSSKNIRAYSTIFANWRVCMFFHKIIWLIVMKIKMIIKIDNIDRILKDLELDKNTNIPIYYTQYIYCEMSVP